jgi:hypothetical protein
MTISVSGIWLRKIGDQVEVLAEVDGSWLKVITEHQDGFFSHIVGPAGILTSPVDELS